MIGTKLTAVYITVKRGRNKIQNIVYILYIQIKRTASPAEESDMLTEHQVMYIRKCTFNKSIKLTYHHCQ